MGRVTGATSISLPRRSRSRLGRRAGFAATALALAVAMLGTTLPTPLYPLYREQLGFSEFLVTVVFAVYAAGVIAGLVLFGMTLVTNMLASVIISRSRSGVGVEL